MTAPLTAQERRRVYSKSGINTLRKAITVLGSRGIDRRSSVGKALAGWRRNLVADLGGQQTISTQQAVIVELAVKQKLLLDSIDAWLLQQPSLINKRSRALLPVVRERQQLADALARYMGQLGLERRARRVPSLSDYLAEQTTAEDGALAVPDTSPSSEPIHRGDSQAGAESAP